MSARRRGRNLPASLASSPLTCFPALAVALLAALALAGCGQMGPLVLPGDADNQGEAGTAAGTEAAAGNAAASGSGDEAEDSNESGGENEQ
jgi:predicted small lipoprotein YifL